MNAHPSRYVRGYPRATPALNLSFNAPNYGAARFDDRAKWNGVDPNELVWIPGTNIIGAIGPFDHDVGTRIGVEDEDADHPILDGTGHGTATASLSGGKIHGPRSRDVLIVVVKGYTKGLAWAAQQPWIDVITNSWNSLSMDENAADASRRAVASGKVVCFAHGNAGHPDLYDPASGPSWNINVGAASASTRGEHAYTNWPNDVLGPSNVDAATRDSFAGKEKFDGTSAAAPNVCGTIAATLARVRKAVGHTDEGPVSRRLISGRRSAGLLDDGNLTSWELEDAVQATAAPAKAALPDPQTDPYSIPAFPLVGFIRGGYGIVDEASARRALGVVLGKKARPDRPNVDFWIDFFDGVRDAIWGPPPRDPDG